MVHTTSSMGALKEENKMEEGFELHKDEDGRMSIRKVDDSKPKEVEAVAEAIPEVKESKIKKSKKGKK